MVDKKEEILVVGGTGFIGYHLVNFLKKKNFKVVVGAAHLPKKKRFVKGIKYIKCDITKKRHFRKFSNFNFKYIVNLGGHVDHTNKKKTHYSHYHGVKNLSKFFLKKEIKSFIQMGSGGEYGNLKSPHKETDICKPSSTSTYSQAKYLATKYLIGLYKKKKFPCTVLRLYQTYGPKQDTNRFLPILITNCLKNTKFQTSHGKQFRDFIFINDLVLIIYKCIKSFKARGQIINVGFGKPINIRKIILKVMKICNGGKPEFGKIVLRKEENIITYPNIDKLKRILLFKPRTSFEKGIRTTIKSYRN